MSLFIENGGNEKVKMAKMVSKLDFQFIFRRGAKFVLKWGQTSCYETKYVKFRFVQEM